MGEIIAVMEHDKLTLCLQPYRCIAGRSELARFISTPVHVNVRVTGLAERVYNGVLQSVLKPSPWTCVFMTQDNLVRYPDSVDAGYDLTHCLMTVVTFSLSKRSGVFFV
jgi:hypothetical protein